MKKGEEKKIIFNFYHYQPFKKKIFNVKIKYFSLDIKIFSKL